MSDNFDSLQTLTSPIRARYRAGRGLAFDLRRRISELEAAVPSVGQPRPHFVFDQIDDLAYRNVNSFMSDTVLTMFTQQWVGIRQACGALSGHKLAIDAHHIFSSHEIGAIANQLQEFGINRVVSHGMAHSTGAVLRGLRKLLPSVKFYGVWHGTMAGWSSPDEVKLFREFLDLADDAIFERIGFLRQGMQSLHFRSFPQILYNIPPKVNFIPRLSTPFSKRPIVCMFASWNNTWKNMYTNLLAAHCSSLVGTVLVYSPPQIEISDKVHVVAFEGHDKHFDRIARVDICLNVSINDCQPMTELEGLSVGTPSLRNDWNLDLDVHSVYEDLFTVRSYLNADAITRKIAEISEHDPEFIADIVAKHRDILIDMSRRRYRDFLDVN